MRCFISRIIDMFTFPLLCKTLRALPSPRELRWASTEELAYPKRGEYFSTFVWLIGGVAFSYLQVNQPVKKSRFQRLSVDKKKAKRQRYRRNRKAQGLSRWTAAKASSRKKSRRLRQEKRRSEERRSNSEVKQCFVPLNLRIFSTSCCRFVHITKHEEERGSAMNSLN